MYAMTRRALPLSIWAILALAACEQGPTTSTANSANVVVPRATSEVKDVERPDIFSATELALWDGRPSLGGVWVAHPDVADPERVLIRNTTNGQTISGALFRRERANPGPRIQLSSDAASALSILAGQPTELSLVAVRQETIEIPGAAAPETVNENGEVEPTDTPADTGENASADAIVAGAAVTAAGRAADGSAKPAKRPFWQRFRQGLTKNPEPGPIVAAEAMTVDTANDASVPEVETDTLDPLVGAAAAIDTAEATEAPEPQPAPNLLKNPYVQIGLFSVAANADAAAVTLRQAGIVPEIQEQSNENGAFWRVLVGPLTSADDQEALLAQVKSLGYRDAYLTPN